MNSRPATIALAFALVTFTYACRHTQVSPPILPATSTADRAELRTRGEYIVRNVSVCGGCHAARSNPDEPLSGGTEFNDWRIGLARASNLTPDPATGLGGWSEADIVHALRSGQRKDGRLLAPVMPYEWFHRMSDEDALAVAQYLLSQEPVQNAVKQSPSIWFKLGKLLFLRPKPPGSQSAPQRAPTPEYGGYLAQHVGLCADCHTPRTGIRQAPDKSRLFSGSANPPKGFPENPANLTPDNETGIGAWSEEDFLRTLHTGVSRRGFTLHPFMPWRQIQRMSDDDLRAIYRYLRTLPPIRNEVPRRTTNERMKP